MKIAESHPVTGCWPENDDYYRFQGNWEFVAVKATEGCNDGNSRGLECSEGLL